MPENTITSHEFGTLPSPHQDAADAHGEAGLLLAESILHALVEAKALTVDQASSAIDTALAVAAESDLLRVLAKGRTKQASSLLSSIEGSFRSIRSHVHAIA